jgi:hypothetical protein
MNTLQRSPGDEAKREAEARREAKRETRLIASAEKKCVPFAITTAEKLCSAEAILKHPDIPEALKGVEGIKRAHEILQEKGERGILIGGLALSIWDSKKSLEDLSNHKDVDILLTRIKDYPEEESEKRVKEYFKNFVDGIDWWVPQEFVSKDKPFQRWLENGHRIILPYTIETGQRFYGPAGLYLPGPKFSIMMKQFSSYECIKKEVDTFFNGLANLKYWDRDDIKKKFFDELQKNIQGEEFNEKIIPKLVEELDDYILEDSGSDGTLEDTSSFYCKSKDSKYNHQDFILKRLSAEEIETIKDWQAENKK